MNGHHGGAGPPSSPKRAGRPWLALGAPCCEECRVYCFDAAPLHHRWCRQVSAAAKHLIGSEMRACRFMDNRGLVASPGHAAAYFPSGGQGGDHAQTRCPPDFRSVHGLCPPRLCDEEAGRPSAGGSPGGPLAAWLGVSHAAAPNCMAPGGDATQSDNATLAVPLHCRSAWALSAGHSSAEAPAPDP
jgi:hypothetical protein